MLRTESQMALGGRYFSIDAVCILSKYFTHFFTGTTEIKQVHCDYFDSQQRWFSYLSKACLRRTTTDFPQLKKAPEIIMDLSLPERKGISILPRFQYFLIKMNVNSKFKNIIYTKLAQRSVSRRTFSFFQFHLFYKLLYPLDSMNC